MRWDRFFEDLEGQLASEWEAERAALDTEAERLRLSRVTVRDRLVALAGGAALAGVELVDDTVLSGRIASVGMDWIAVDAVAARHPAATAQTAAIVPTAAIRSLNVAHEELLRSARPPASVARASLADRMGLGFVVRDAARRRLPVTLHLLGGRALSGTADRAGADHLDIALHDPGAPRRSAAVTGHRLVPFASIAWLRMDAATDIHLG